jgi:arabinogalactan oligomer/maltooligosaccharide transport system substrate-binding protein
LGASLLAACNNGEEVKEPTTPKDTDKKPVEKVEITPEEGAKLLFWDNGDAEGEWAKFVASEFTKNTVSL